MTNIESEIKAIIEDVICGKYVGKFRVIKEEVDDSIIWMLLLYLDLEMSPLVMAYEGSEEQFKNFVRDEIKTRKLQDVKFWTALQNLPTIETDDNYE